MENLILSITNVVGSEVSHTRQRTAATLGEKTDASRWH